MSLFCSYLFPLDYSSSKKTALRYPGKRKYTTDCQKKPKTKRHRANKAHLRLAKKESRSAGSTKTQRDFESLADDKTTARDMAGLNRRHSPNGPRAIAVRFRLAKALFLAGHCDQAVRAAAEAVRRAPRHAQAADTLFDQASCLVKLGRFEQAAQTYRRIEREHPGRADTARRELDRIRPASRPASHR